MAKEKLKTRAELSEVIAERDAKLKALDEKLRLTENELRRFQQDSNRHEKNWQDCERRLAAVRQVIGSTLEVKHQKSVTESQEYFRGQMVKEDASEEVRLLRHIFSLSNNQPPF